MWQDHAACAGHDPELWHSEGGHSAEARSELHQWSSERQVWDTGHGASRPPAIGASTPAEGLAEPQPSRAEVRLMEPSYVDAPPVNLDNEPQPLSECLADVLAQMIRREATLRGDR